jgi:hypothetical protein
VAVLATSALLCLTAPAASAAEAGPRTGASWGGTGELQAAETRTDVDPVGDANPCNGDITQFGAGYSTPEGQGFRAVVVATETACANDVTQDTAWVVGLSYAGWYLDTDEDGAPDYWVVLENDGGVYARSTT